MTPERPLTDALAPFAAPDIRRSSWQLASSIVAFAGLWTLAFLSLDHSYAVTLLCAVPAAIVLVRLFIIQHDCGHGSFLPSRRASDLIGSLLGLFTLTPYAYWRKLHAIHHASSGNLDKRGTGDIETLTVREYLALGRLRRARYRVVRHPVVVLVAGSAYQFYFLHRLPGGLQAGWRREWWSVWFTNLGLAIAIALAWWLIGIGPFLLVHLPITWLAGSIGIWLFYVQHQFEETYWAPDEAWSFERASMAGSSYLDLPPLLRWCTGNIGFHHIHHLCPRIPNYRLSSASDAHPVLGQATRLSLTDSLKCLSLKLWDENQMRLVGFRELGKLRN